MNFADLTWERDIKDVDGNDLGWRAEYEAPNGYLLCVECVVDFLAENGEPALMWKVLAIPENNDRKNAKNLRVPRGCLIDYKKWTTNKPHNYLITTSY
jgi:hypothetical protein